MDYTTTERLWYCEATKHHFLDIIVEGVLPVELGGTPWQVVARTLANSGEVVSGQAKRALVKHIGRYGHPVCAWAHNRRFDRESGMLYNKLRKLYGHHSFSC